MYRIKYNNSESFTHRQVNILISLHFKSDISAHKAFLDNNNNNNNSLYSYSRTPVCEFTL